MTDLAELIQVLDVDAAGEGRFRAATFAGQRRLVVEGSPIVAQSIVAATLSMSGKRVKSLQMIFSRAARTGADVRRSHR